MRSKENKTVLKKVIAITSAMSLCICTPIYALADDAKDNFLKDMAEGLIARWAYDSDEDAMSNSEIMEYRTQLVNEEYDRISKYEKEDFENEKFSLMAHAYIEAIEMQLDAVKYYTEVPDIYNSEWSAGYNMRAILIPDFVDHYGLDVPEEEVEPFRTDSGKPASSDTLSSEETNKDDKEQNELEIELYNDQGIKVVLTGMKEPNYTSTDFYIRIENLNHHDIVVTTDDSQMVVNGPMMYSPLWVEVQSGKTANVTMSFWKSDLDSAGIDVIREMTMNISIMDANTFDILYKGDEKFVSISEDNKISEKAVYTDKENIQKVQELLNSAGYDCGSADGVPGKQTNSALLQFEKDHGLQETTDITPELIEALENAIG